MSDAKLAGLADLSWAEQISFPSSRKLRNSPHFIGARYPCRSIAFVPRIILNELASYEDLNILDPFMGSGTTAIEASKFSNNIYGLEVDPYARLIASVSSRKYSSNDIRVLKDFLQKILSTVSGQDVDDAFSPNLKNIDYWFEQENFDQLLRLKKAIFKIVDNSKYQDFFLTAFGDIIRAVSKAERQSLKPYISKKYLKVTKAVIPEFQKIATKYITCVADTHDNKSSEIKWLDGDATSFVANSKIDLAISSPPYLNAMDYTRCIKLESAWIGTGNDTSIKGVKRKQLGEAIRRHITLTGKHALNFSQKYFHELEEIDKNRFSTLVAYFDDMENHLRCMHSALRNGGSYFIIMGDSQIRGIEIPTHRILAQIAECIGFSWSSYFKYPIKDHRTSIPRGSQGGKIEVEHVIELKK